MWKNLYTIQNTGIISMPTIIALICSIGAIVTWSKAQKAFSKKYNDLIKKSLFILLPIITVTLYISIKIDYTNYSGTVKKYNDGDYMIVEGYISNYDTNCDEITGRDDDEYFEVEGIGFGYRDIQDSVGYHTLRRSGGVIKGNGQYVKIMYTSIKRYDKNINVILRIDELVP